MSKEQTFKRKEIKYLLNDTQYKKLLPEIKKLATIDSYGLTRINNIYYDTPDHLLIRNSLEKPVYKEKLRLRTYGDTDNSTAAFVEIKKKYKGVVYKRRFESIYEKAFLYLAGCELPDERTQVTDEVDEFINTYKGLRPAMVIGYNRIAMAGIYDKEFRVTFDTDITWRDRSLDLTKGSQGKRIIEEGQHLMEIKIPDAFPMELSYVLSELEIFPVSFSKYGRGYIDSLVEGQVRNVAALNSNLALNGNTSLNGAAVNITDKEKGEMAYA